MNIIKESDDFKQLQEKLIKWSGSSAPFRNITGEKALIKIIAKISHKKQLRIQNEAESLMDDIEKCYKNNNNNY